MIAAMTPLARLSSLTLAVALLSCAPSQPVQQVYVGGQPAPSGELTATEVSEATRGVRRGEVVIYRAPVLRLAQKVDLRSGGLTTSGGMGEVELARSGYLFAEKNPATGAVNHFAVFQWDLVEGENRYARVELPDGRELPFRTATAKPDPCVPNCFPLIQTLIVEIPGDALRSVPDAGLEMKIVLDNGFAFQVGAPAPYVRGYLEAVDAG